MSLCVCLCLCHFCFCLPFIWDNGQGRSVENKLYIIKKKFFFVTKVNHCRKVKEHQRTEEGIINYAKQMKKFSLNYIFCSQSCSVTGTWSPEPRSSSIAKYKQDLSQEHYRFYDSTLFKSVNKVHVYKKCINWLGKNLKMSNEEAFHFRCCKKKWGMKSKCRNEILCRH